MTTNCKIELFGTLENTPKQIKNKTTAFLVMSLATRDMYKEESTGRQKERTLWHEVIVFDPEVIKATKGLQKGQLLNIIGTLSYRTVEKADGYKTSHASIIATTINEG